MHCLSYVEPQIMSSICGDHTHKTFVIKKIIFEFLKTKVIHLCTVKNNSMNIKKCLFLSMNSFSCGFVILHWESIDHIQLKSITQIHIYIKLNYHSFANACFCDFIYVLKVHKLDQRPKDNLNTQIKYISSTPISN